jgi:hypothetical protein
MSKPRLKNPRVGYSWGILLGMASIPILLVMSKVFPQLEMAWQVLMAVCGLVVLRSAVRYVFPNGMGGVKKSDRTVTQSH